MFYFYFVSVQTGSMFVKVLEFIFDIVQGFNLIYDLTLDELELLFLTKTCECFKKKFPSNYFS